MSIAQSDDDFFKELYALGRPFKPTAYFDEEMDQLIYVCTNDTYRADRIDPFLTLLWHATDAKLIGVKIKGFRSIFEKYKKCGSVAETDFLPLKDIITWLLNSQVKIQGGWGNGTAPQLNVEELYQEAVDVVGKSDSHKNVAQLYKEAVAIVGDYKWNPEMRLAA
ncbi:MAG: hypothetical protein WCF85_01855 [Rhodospirillaceae bacterium]